MKNLIIPADVPKGKVSQYVENYNKATGGSDRLMLFAGDQKVEHLNKDFYGEGIADEDANPEHLFKVASQAKIGVFATQMGLISRYGNQYNKIPYLVKLNSKTNIVPVDESAPISRLWFNIEDVISLKNYSGLNILGIGYTIYLGSEHENIMLQEAAQTIFKAHQEGMIAVLWIYPKGKYIKDEHDPHLIAGAAGVAATLGADFVKLKVPFSNGKFDVKLLKEVTEAAGNTGVLCEGGAKVAEKDFLQELYDQIHLGNTRGNGTGRNIHQRSFDEAVKMANAIYSVTIEGKTAEEAWQTYFE